MNERILSESEIEALRKHWATAPTIDEAAKRIGICRETARLWARKIGLVRPNTNPWTPERIEILKDLWSRGVSASNIAYQLGCGITRNAVLGKAHRLGIVVKGQRTTAYGKSERKHKRPTVTFTSSGLECSVFGKSLFKLKPGRRVIPDNSGLEAASSQNVDDVARVQFSELSERDCRFPVGTPGTSGFGFCGLPRIPGSSYCSGHHARCWQPVPIRRRPDSTLVRETTPVKIDA